MSHPGDSPINPYAAPQANLQSAETASTTRAVPFYAMSPVKAAVMSVLTVGLYDLWFWWRHWRARRNYGQDVSVFWRTVFAGLCGFDFKSKLSAALIDRNLTPAPLLAAAPGVYFLCLAIDKGLSRLPALNGWLLGVSVLSSVTHGAALAVLQTAANQVLEADGYRGPFNRGVQAGTIAAAIAGVLLWALGVFGVLDGVGQDPS